MPSLSSLILLLSGSLAAFAAPTSQAPKPPVPSCPEAQTQSFTVQLGAPNRTATFAMACDEETEVEPLETKYVSDFGVCMEICTAIGSCKDVTYTHANGTLAGSCQIKTSIGTGKAKKGAWRAWEVEVINGD